jgi:hypothetical protein
MRHFRKQNALQVLTLNKHSSKYIMNLVGGFNMVGKALGHLSFTNTLPQGLTTYKGLLLLHEDLFIVS